MKYDYVKQQINLWDPIGLLIHTPDDEYEDEIKQIYFFLNSSKNLSKETVGKKIYDIFSCSFDSTFNQSLAECIHIAEKLLEYKL